MTRSSREVLRPATYGEDLAAFHHAHATELARQAATTLVDELAEASLHRGTIVDVGCGTGVLAAELLAAGYDVMGIDPSEAALTIAAATAPGAELQHATASTMWLPSRVVGIACVGEVLSYDLDLDLEEVLDQLHAALRPGGVLLLDLPTPGRHRDRGTTVHDVEGALLVMAAEERAFRATRSISLFTEMADGAYRRADEVHELRLYDPADVRSGLSRSGFVAIRQLDRYGADGPPFGRGWVGFVAEKP